MYFLIIIALLSGFTTVSAADKIIKVKIAKANLELVENSLNYPVLIKSRVNSQVKADSELIVISSKVSLGQKIKKGEPLLELRHSDLTTNYRNRILKAPVSGVIAGIHVQTGNYVNKGSLLVTINDPENIYGKIEIPVSDYKKIKKGLRAELTFDSNVKAMSEVIGVGAMANTELGTVPVEVKFLIEQELLPGTIGRAKVLLKEENLILIEENALYYSGEDILIPLVVDQVVEKVQVKLGRRFKNKVEVLSGLEEGQAFVIDAPKFLRNKQKVESDVKKDT